MTGKCCQREGALRNPWALNHYPFQLQELGPVHLTPSGTLKHLERKMQYPEREREPI